MCEHVSAYIWESVACLGVYLYVLVCEFGRNVSVWMNASLCVCVWDVRWLCLSVSVVLCDCGRVCV